MVHTSSYFDCSTRLCTVQFMKKSWLGTDINTSDGEQVNKFCFWNHYVNSDQIIVTERNEGGTGFQQVSHTLQVFVNFRKNNDLNPKLVLGDYERDIQSQNLGFQSYYICHLITYVI